jgi:hypothetical protein
MDGARGDVAQRLGIAARGAVERRRSGEDGGPDRAHRVAAERLLAGQRLPEHDAERVDVPRLAGVCAAEALGWQVARLADQRVGAGARAGLVREHGDAEIRQLHPPVDAEEDVGRRHVAVDEPVADRVDVVERIGDVGGHVRHHRHRQRDAGGVRVVEDVRQREAAHVLHHDVVAALVLDEVEHLHHVLVIEPDADERLLEQVDDVAALRAEHLHDHRLLEPGGAVRGREIHVSHAPVPEELQHAVAADLRTPSVHACDITLVAGG